MRAIFTLTLISLAFLAFFFNRGFAYYDEGFILHAAQRVLRGEIPHRDFDFIYTPGTIFLLAAVFKVFGESIVVGRILTMVVGVLTALLIYLITNRISKNKLVSFLAMLVYLAWGPSHVNFPWPTLFAFSSGLLATFFLSKTLMRSLDSEFIPSKVEGLGMTNAGFMTFVTFLMKQNFGLAVFLSFVSGLGLVRPLRQMRNFLNYLTGLTTGFLAFIVYLFLTNSLNSFRDNFYFYTIKKILLEGVAGSTFPTGVKGLFYLFPGLISLTAIFVAYKRQRNLIVWPLFTFLFYLFGIRPTTDFIHLTTLMSLSGLPLSIIISKFQVSTNKKQTNSKSQTGNYSKINSFGYLNFVNLNFFWSTCWLVFGAFLIGLGFYTALFKNYYRWDSPLVKQNYFIAEPKAKIFVDQKFNKIIPEIISEIKNNTAKGDYIFIFPNAPLFYFLTERKNPTRYLNLPLGLHTAWQEREMVDDLRQNRVRIILTNEIPRDWRYSLISDYILKNYRKKKEIFEFTLWEKDESGRRSAVQSK